MAYIIHIMAYPTDEKYNDLALTTAKVESYRNGEIVSITL